MHLTRNMGIGGLEKVIYDICRHSDKQVFDMSVCCMHFKGEFGHMLEQEGFRVSLVPNLKTVDRTGFWKIARILKEEKPDIIHTHNSHAFIDGTLASLFSGVGKIINTDHARNFPDRRHVMFLERMAARFALKIVAVSEHTRDNLIKYEKIPYKILQVIYNGIDTNVFGKTIDTKLKSSELGIGDYTPIIGLGVRLSAQKGLSYLLEAVKLLIVEFPRLLLMIAGGGEQKEYLEGLSVSLGIEKNVKFLGPRTDWNEILQVLDVYVLPSVWEGFPLAVLEAMSARKPIVATAVGGVPSAIIDNDTGLLVPARDVTKLFEALQTVIADRNLRKRLADRAFEKVNSDFTVQHMVKNYEKLYLESINGVQ